MAVTTFTLHFRMKALNAIFMCIFSVSIVHHKSHRASESKNSIRQVEGYGERRRCLKQNMKKREFQKCYAGFDENVGISSKPRNKFHWLGSMGAASLK